MSRLRALRLFPSVFSGTHLELPEVRLLRTRGFVLTTEPALAVEADGEALGATPASYRALPGELPIVVPPGRVPVVQPAVATN